MLQIGSFFSFTLQTDQPFLMPKCVIDLLIHEDTVIALSCFTKGPCMYIGTVLCVVWVKHKTFTRCLLWQQKSAATYFKFHTLVNFCFSASFIFFKSNKTLHFLIMIMCTFYIVHIYIYGTYVHMYINLKR